LQSIFCRIEAVCVKTLHDGKLFFGQSKQPKLLDRVRAAVQFNNYSPRTEQTYVDSPVRRKLHHKV
jgi:hypothetical protein